MVAPLYLSSGALSSAVLLPPPSCPGPSRGSRPQRRGEGRAQPASFTVALVSNIVDGTVPIFSIQGKTVSKAGSVEVGATKPGGRTVLDLPPRMCHGRVSLSFVNVSTENVSDPEGEQRCPLPTMADLVTAPE